MYSRPGISASFVSRPANLSSLVLALFKLCKSKLAPVLILLKFWKSQLALILVLLDRCRKAFLPLLHELGVFVGSHLQHPAAFYVIRL
jgi:hypothetical protein